MNSKRIQTVEQNKKDNVGYWKRNSIKIQNSWKIQTEILETKVLVSQIKTQLKAWTEPN
jgi:hypothetical protein